ncbi:unnamed protein product [Rotaria sordida]|uniref:Microbial-type PARG catalytic domain-containing protein n=1 Tax=Rotaria sordida TaxID=392033 RepID=A0A814DVT3_9BILA|nr:unnamed protein product [Rotaria sordida]
MADPINPGGGYRKGSAAQEESFFRRSDYYQSLDLEIADLNRSQRFHCTEKCTLERLPSYGRLYSMDEFGAIYTSGITVFRQAEPNGYAYMDEPLYNVCSIAMAAYREPKLKNNTTVTNKYAAGTYKKIENIFAIGHHHQHDSLVLSAFGCGAFKNPPRHIALLFKSAIQKYAGYFRIIYFAIIDDHNTGHTVNPQGNLLPFKQILDGFVAQPSHTIFVNSARGPYRILDKPTDEQITLSSVCVFDQPSCYYGAKCNDLRNIQHNKDYSHPPLCPNSDKALPCNSLIDDEIHAYCFIHRLKCKNGGECSNTDSEHQNEYDHPGFCNDPIRCGDMSAEHLFAYRHLPSCQEGVMCSQYLKKDTEHTNKFRHFKAICSQCYNKTEQHLQTSIHIARKFCPDSNQCSKLDQDDHLETFSHPEIFDIRWLCKYPGYQCPNRLNNQHLRKYRHSRNHNHVGVARYSGFNTLINFFENQAKLIESINNHFNKLSLDIQKPSSEILSWIRALQPVHRCQQHVFESILLHNHVMSLDYMESLKYPQNVINAVQQHYEVRRILFHYNNQALKEHIFEYIATIINRITNEVTLSHAGANSIYNHEKIEYKFNANELDLSKIDFIHVSAGAQDVPVRNLTINHELISELHPSFDEDFKIDTSHLLPKMNENRSCYVSTVTAPSNCYVTTSTNDTLNVNSDVNSTTSSCDNTSEQTCVPNPYTKPKVSLEVSLKPRKLTWLDRLKRSVFHANSNVQKRTVKGFYYSSNNSLSSTFVSWTACSRSIYCLDQNSEDHIRNFSHPCRYSELCHNQDNEPHLTHEHHNVPKCSVDENCQQQTDPIHRAHYRHTNLSDYMIPCHSQQACNDKSWQHRLNYFHGENLSENMATNNRTE